MTTRGVASLPAHLPSVGVVVPTRGGRLRELSTAVWAAQGQDYRGRVEIVVVLDRRPGEPGGDAAEESLVELLGPEVRIVRNEHLPGLAGSRNSGILALSTDLVAFCDDDDEWLPGKLRAQVTALLAAPGAEFSSCSIVVEYDHHRTARRAGCDRVRYGDLLRSRMVMVHASTFLAYRQALVERIGLVNEAIPASQNEDWDLALRAARRRPIVHVDEPLVRVVWGKSSYFEERWASKAAGLEWMLAHHPDLRRGSGAGRVYGQLAFANACLGRRVVAARFAARSLVHNWREPRVPVALAVASGLVSGNTVLRALHTRGHGV